MTHVANSELMSRTHDSFHIRMTQVPPMARARGRDSVIGLVLGFSLGVLVMIGLSIFLEEVNIVPHHVANS